MGNCQCVSGTARQVKTDKLDPNQSVFQYDKDSRKIVYVGENNAEGIPLAQTASASTNNSDNGSVKSYTSSKDGDRSDRDNSVKDNQDEKGNMNNVRSLLGEIAEYLEEGDESTLETNNSIANASEQNDLTSPLPTMQLPSENTNVTFSTSAAALYNISPLPLPFDCVDKPANQADTKSLIKIPENDYNHINETLNSDDDESQDISLHGIANIPSEDYTDPERTPKAVTFDKDTPMFVVANTDDIPSGEDKSLDSDDDASHISTLEALEEVIARDDVKTKYLLSPADKSQSISIDDVNTTTDDSFGSFMHASPVSFQEGNKNKMESDENVLAEKTPDFINVSSVHIVVPPDEQDQQVEQKAVPSPNMKESSSSITDAKSSINSVLSVIARTLPSPTSNENSYEIFDAEMIDSPRNEHHDRSPTMGFDKINSTKVDNNYNNSPQPPTGVCDEFQCKEVGQCDRSRTEIVDETDNAVNFDNTLVNSIDKLFIEKSSINNSIKNELIEEMNETEAISISSENDGNSSTTVVTSHLNTSRSSEEKVVVNNSSFIPTERTSECNQPSNRMQHVDTNAHDNNADVITTKSTSPTKYEYGESSGKSEINSFEENDRNDNEYVEKRDSAFFGASARPIDEDEDDDIEDTTTEAIEVEMNVVDVMIEDTVKEAITTSHFEIDCTDEVAESSRTQRTIDNADEHGHIEASENAVVENIDQFTEKFSERFYSSETQSPISLLDEHEAVDESVQVLAFENLNELFEPFEEVFVDRTKESEDESSKPDESAQTQYPVGIVDDHNVVEKSDETSVEGEEYYESEQTNVVDAQEPVEESDDFPSEITGPYVEETSEYVESTPQTQPSVVTKAGYDLDYLMDFYGLKETRSADTDLISTKSSQIPMSRMENKFEELSSIHSRKVNVKKNTSNVSATHSPATSDEGRMKRKITPKRTQIPSVASHSPIRSPYKGSRRTKLDNQGYTPPKNSLTPSTGTRTPEKRVGYTPPKKMHTSPAPTRASILRIATTNSKNTPENGGLNSVRSLTSVKSTPNSLPWDEKDRTPLRSRSGSFDVDSPTGGASVCSANSFRSNPDYIHQGRRAAHERVKAVRSSEKSDKKKSCANSKWNPTCFGRKSGCVRCISLASKRERHQYVENGRHQRITMTSGGCRESCSHNSELLRNLSTLGIDEESARLCRICFNAVHRPVQMLKNKDEKFRALEY